MKISTATPNSSPIITIYGAEGRGKTTLATKAPAPIAFLLERGLPKGVSVDAVEDVTSFEGILAALRELWSDQRGYQTLIVDTLDGLEALIVEYTCNKHGWKNIEQPAYGKGWIVLDGEWKRFIRAIAAIRDKGMTVILVAHADVTRVDDPRTPSYTSYAPRLHKRGRALIMDACDAVFFLSEDLRITSENDRARATASPMRHLFTEGSPAFSAKNRFAMPSKIALPLDASFDTIAQYWAP